MKTVRRISILFAFAALFALAMPAAAATTVVVTPTNTQGWSTVDTKSGGNVTFVADETSPYPSGALQLTTAGTNDSKAQYMHEANTPLGEITALSYFTKQIAGPAVAAPSYQLVVDLNGAADGGFTTLVYEPYWNGTVVPGVWQEWDVDAGQFWSSKSFNDGSCVIIAAPGGPPSYSLAGLQAACPDAVVIGFGVNIGTYNPNYVVETDGVNFNGTTYDFELFQAATDKDQCKNGGWQGVTDASGQPFKNEGDCVSYVANGGKGK